jgi:hypothetical protein
MLDQKVKVGADVQNAGPSVMAGASANTDT